MNMWRSVRFALDGQVFERRLVYAVADPAGEINVKSAVGRALLTAQAGDELTVSAPGGDVVVKVLDIDCSGNETANPATGDKRERMRRRHHVSSVPGSAALRHNL